MAQGDRNEPTNPIKRASPGVRESIGKDGQKENRASGLPLNLMQLDLWPQIMAADALNTQKNISNNSFEFCQ